MRLKGKRVKKQRVELKKKRSGICTKEHEIFMKACEAVLIDVTEEIKVIRENHEKVMKIEKKNKDDRGKKYLLKVSQIEGVGESYEEKEQDEGEAKLKATLIETVEVKTYDIDQGEDSTCGKQIMLVYTKTGLREVQRDAGPDFPWV